MPKLKDLVIRHQNKAGDVYEYKSPCNVSTEGQFTVNLPDDLEEIIGTFTVHNRECPIPEKFDVRVYTHQHKWRVSSSTLEGIQKYIRKLIELKMECVKIIERVIVYRHQADYCIWVAPDGSLHPNGSLSVGMKKAAPDMVKGKWMGTLNGSMGMHKPSVYSVGIGAKVFDKVTYRSPAGGKDRHEYILVQEDVIQDEGIESTYLHKLNAMIGTSIGHEDRFSSSHGAEEMPYSEDAAQFFYDAIIAINGIAMKMDTFFQDKVNIKKAIESRVRLLGIGDYSKRRS